MTETTAKQRCCCPVGDAHDCALLRYGNLAEGELCECICHDLDEDEEEREW